LNHAPNNDVVYYLAGNKFHLESLTKKTTFDCVSEEMEHCSACTKSINAPMVKRCELCAYGRDIAQNKCLAKVIPPAPKPVNPIPTQVDRPAGTDETFMNIPLVRSVKSGEAKDLIKLCDDGSIFFLNKASNTLKYSLNLDDYKEKEPVTVTGKFRQIECD
jgi:hypothetical protein